ncbi:MAG: c-type cytochrome domain-containing protein, partial [Verrucomicrobiales bacterium]
MKFILSSLLFVAACVRLSSAEEIFSSRCFECHGPDEHHRKGKLRLDQTGELHGAYRTINDSTAIKPGSALESELWQRITSDDPDSVMPPPEAKKRPLSEKEKQLVK